MPTLANRYLLSITLFAVTLTAAAQNYFGSDQPQSHNQSASPTKTASPPLSPTAFKDKVKTLDTQNKTYLRQLFDAEVAKMGTGSGARPPSPSTSTSPTRSPSTSSPGTTTQSPAPDTSGYSGFGTGSPAGSSGGSSTGSGSGSGLGIQY